MQEQDCSYMANGMRQGKEKNHIAMEHTINMFTVEEQDCIDLACEKWEQIKGKYPVTETSS